MKKYLIFAFLTAVSLVGCPNSHTGNDCMDAEAHLKDLGCIPKDQPYTAKGKSFEQFCQDTMNNGIDLHPTCLSVIKSCDQINSCVQAK